MKKRRVTQEEVAKLAGVSKTTVSSVLNNCPEIRISPETRQQVLEIVRQLSYKLPIIPEETKTEVIGIVISRYIPDFFKDPYYLKIYESFTKELKNKGYLTAFATVEEKFNQDYFIPEPIYKEKVDGIAIMGTSSEEFIRKFYTCKIKMVLVNFSCDEAIDSVWFNNVKVVHKILYYLFSLGHRRFALVLPESEGANFTLREKAFSSFIKTYHLPPSLNPVFKTDFNTEESAYEKIKSVIPQIKKMGVTAILGADDLLAFGAIKALTAVGLEVPGDISVAGIDDIEEARNFSLPLTTVRIPKEEMGKVAAQRLMERIENPNIPCQKIFLSSKLIIRKSTCPVKNVKGDEHSRVIPAFAGTATTYLFCLCSDKACFA